MVISMSMTRGLVTILAAGVLLTGAARAQEDKPDEIDLAEIVRRPVIGNYRGYAEFKMAHYASARRIWEALDERNFAEAAFNLGILHEDGLGVPRDIQRALAYYRRGAEGGSPKASYRLGILYWLGAPGVAIDREQGRRYLGLAAAAGDSEARQRLQSEEAGAGDDPLLRADRLLASGDAAAYVEVLKQAAMGGHIRAQTRLAWSYEAGRGIGRDLAAAAQWFARAAAAGDGEAMYALAVMHGTGAGQAKDAVESERWLQRSAAAGYPAALADLKRRPAAE